MADCGEKQTQAGLVKYLTLRGHTFAADMSGLYIRTPAGRKAAKAAGRVPGEPDLRIYLPGGKLVLIELKAANGRLSPDQKDRHATLRALGFAVHVVKAQTPADAVQQVDAILKEENNAKG